MQDDSAIAQSVERMTVNHDVVGSSPTGGVIDMGYAGELSELAEGARLEIV